MPCVAKTFSPFGDFPSYDFAATACAGQPSVINTLTTPITAASATWTISTTSPSGTAFDATTTTTSAASSSVDVGAAVGGAIGGFAALIVIVLCLVVMFYRRKSPSSGKKSADGSAVAATTSINAPVVGNDS